MDLTFYRDGDGDGFGDPRGETRTACAAPEGFALRPLDCDDGDAARSPASEERCNGLDDDCDGVAAFRVGPQIAGQLCLADVEPEAATWLEAFRVRTAGQG